MDSSADNTAAWRDLNFSIKMGAFGEVPPGDYEIFLKINDSKEQSANKRCIRFANHNIWYTSLAANLIGLTTVVPYIYIGNGVNYWLRRRSVVTSYLSRSTDPAVECLYIIISWRLGYEKSI